MSNRMPAAFIGHGSPMNTLDTNRYTETWRRFGESMPQPRAVLVISAHWYINASAVTAMAHPKTIHDFYGFPQELFDVQYPAPGAPDVAKEIAQLLEPARVGLDQDSWGLDHGAWSVLVHVFPKADIPVLQLSINASQDFDYHVELGAKLAPLRDRGVLILGSGNVVHNLQRIDWKQPDAAFDWNQRFDGAAKNLMISSPADIGQLRDHADYDLAVPTPEHFIPLLYLAGLAKAEGTTAETLIEGFAMASISMTAFALGADCDCTSTNDHGAPPIDSDHGGQMNI